MYEDTEGVAGAGRRDNERDRREKGRDEGDSSMEREIPGGEEGRDIERKRGESERWVIGGARREKWGRDGRGR